MRPFSRDHPIETLKVRELVESDFTSDTFFLVVDYKTVTLKSNEGSVEINVSNTYTAHKKVLKMKYSTQKSTENDSLKSCSDLLKFGLDETSFPASFLCLNSFSQSSIRHNQYCKDN